MVRPFLIALSLALAAQATASSVYLNGVRIDGVRSTTFEKATVRIDAEGNVHIDAPGYAAKVVDGPSDATVSRNSSPGPELPRPARITQRYWLVASQSVPGMAEYEFDVYVNARWLMKLGRGVDQEVHDITRHLRPGRNTVLLQARKVDTGGPRKSYSAKHTYTVVIGAGNEGGGNVMIDEPLITYRKSAADDDSGSREFTLDAR